MDKKQAVPELKSERVQEEVMAVTEEPFRFSLKAERVQEPAAFLVGPDPEWIAAVNLNLELSSKQTVKIELTTLGTIVTI